MHEVNNRLAALTNLLFLARSLATSSNQTLQYLDEADLQLRSLGEITSRSLSFIRLETEAKEIDLVELAPDARYHRMIDGLGPFAYGVSKWHRREQESGSSNLSSMRRFSEVVGLDHYYGFRCRKKL
jgi:hypothetical protein